MSTKALEAKKRFAWQVWDRGSVSRVRVYGRFGLASGSCSACAVLDRELAFHAAHVGLRMHVGVWKLGRCGKSSFGRCCACVSRGRCRDFLPSKVRRACFCVIRAHGVRFTWQAWERSRAFCVAGAGNRALQVNLLDFLAPCEKSRACVSG